MVTELEQELKKANRVAVLTGAGMSTESGLPDFRSQDGLWKTHRPEELASVDALMHMPLRFYEFYRYRLELMQSVKPNPAHFALAKLQQEGPFGLIITQNVDGLHQDAGSTAVAEIHGTLRTAHCHRCRKTYPATVLQEIVEDQGDIPHCSCGGPIRPGVVLFGETLPESPYLAAVEELQACDGLLVIGSSLLVHPAASLPQIALERGIPLWIVNLTETPFDRMADLTLRAKAGDVLPVLADALT